MKKGPEIHFFVERENKVSAPHGKAWQINKPQAAHVLTGLELVENIEKLYW